MSRSSLFIVLLVLSLPLLSAQKTSGGSSSSSTTYHHTSSSSSGGSCSAGCGAAIGGVIAFIAIVAIIWWCCRTGAFDGGQEVRNQEYLQSTPTGQRVASIIPCNGTWRGSYRGHSYLNGGSHLMSVEFSFQGTHVQGFHGSDEVGNFTMEGDINENKIAFVKRYGYERPVRYQGIITSQSSMSGTWHLQNGDNGTWELSCVQPTQVVVMAQHAQSQPVYQASVAQPMSYAKQEPHSHVIELNHLTTPQPFGYTSATVTNTPYSHPSPHHTPRSITPRSITPHLSSTPPHDSPRLSAIPQPGTPQPSTPRRSASAVSAIHSQIEGMPSDDMPPPYVQTYIPTYGVPSSSSPAS